MLCMMCNDNAPLMIHGSHFACKKCLIEYLQIKNDDYTGSCECPAPGCTQFFKKKILANLHFDPEEIEREADKIVGKIKKED